MRYSHSETRPAFLTTDEVLDYLKVTSRTIYRLIRAGDLPAVRIGRQWRFRQSDLDAWLDRQRASTN
jgi:excisionase family DNA binding protein